MTHDIRMTWTIADMRAYCQRNVELTVILPRRGLWFWEW